jgi:amidase
MNNTIIPRFVSGHVKSIGRFLVLLLSILLCFGKGTSQTKPFHLLEATVEDVHAAYKSGQLTSRQLVQLYLNRIDAYDKKGPNLNSVISVNPNALEEADRLDAAFKASGLVGPLHGIPVMLKDMIDAKGMPTTQGSLLFEEYYPDRDSFVVEKLKAAGAIILGKATLGELGAGDAHGSLFGSSRNPYDPERTVGGSSGGSGAVAAANFTTLAIGQEGFASIRRPSTWNSIVGLFPTPGLVGRSGMAAGGTGPMTRTVTDLAKLLDVMVGYDPEDPSTARGVGHIPDTYTKFLDPNRLRGARIGILRESIGFESEPMSEDFRKVTTVFAKAVNELKAAGAILVDPIEIPRLKELLAKRAGGAGDGGQSFKSYFGRSARSPFSSPEEMLRHPDYAKVVPYSRREPYARRDSSIGPRNSSESPEMQHYRYLLAKEELMNSILKLMADNKLDAIIYKAVEHQPTLIKDGIGPPWVNTKGVSDLNTFMSWPAIVVPAGYTTDNLPAGITILARPFEEGTLISLAYAYEQATHHRKPPSTTPPLPGEPGQR